MGTVEWIVVAIVAFIIGAGAGFALANAGRRRDTANFNEVEKELEDYRARVSQHFEQAATHFQAIGEQYRALYEHMAEGSQALCKTGDAGVSLKFPRPGELAPEGTPDDDRPTVENSEGKAKSGPEAAPAGATSADQNEDPHAGKTEEARPAIAGKKAEALGPAADTEDEKKPHLYH